MSKIRDRVEQVILDTQEEIERENQDIRLLQSQRRRIADTLLSKFDIKDEQTRNPGN